MSDLDPAEVLKDLDEETLELMADKAGVTVPKNKSTKEVEKDKLIEQLLVTVIKEGTNRVLQVLKNKALKELVTHKEVNLEEKWQQLSPRRARSKSPSRERKRSKSPGGKKKKEGKEFPSKNVMVKVLSEHLENKDVKEFLEKYSRDQLLMCCQDIDDLSSYKDEELAKFKKQDLIDAILKNINNFGINHMFQTLTVQELKKVCERLDLEVASTSKDKLIESIIEKKSYKKKSKPREKHSDTKPDIKKGIKKVDLEHYYNREDLEKWLKEKKEEDPDTLKDMKISGKKSELVTRILKFLDGDIEGIKKKKGGRGKRKRGSSKSRSDVSQDEGSKDEGSEDKEKKKRKTTTEEKKREVI